MTNHPLLMATTAITVLVIVQQINCIQNSHKSVVDPNFEGDFLSAHNYYRSLHGTPPLKYDDKLNKEAQSWANYLAYNNILMHSSNGYGENIHRTWSSNPNKQVHGFKPVTSWYAEIENYDFQNGKAKTFGGTVGHFTQLIWKSTRRIGVGVAISKTNRVYIVANYFPQGNYEGRFKVNVLPPQGQGN